MQGHADKAIHLAAVGLPLHAKKEMGRVPGDVLVGGDVGAEGEGAVGQEAVLQAGQFFGHG